MNVLQRLTVANLRQNKRRTLVTVLGVMLSTALMLAVTGIVTSLQQMMVNFSIEHYGDFHDMYQEVPVEALKYIEENKHVQSYYYSEPLTNKNVDEELIEYYQVYQTEPYTTEYYTRIDQLPADAKGKYNIFVRYDNPKEYRKFHDDIRATLEEAADEFIYVRSNKDLLRYESSVMSDSSLATLYSLAAIVIGIIVVTSVFVIRNSFSISAQERSRQFGMLSSIGATPKQIRHSIIFEGLVIGAIGIPLGLLLGTVAVAILVVIMNLLMSGSLEGQMVTFCMPFWIFPVAILLGLITIFFSSLIPAIRTARISPIEAIRGNNDIKIKAKKLHTSKFVKNTFGIGGVIASKNLKRSRKKYRTTVVSLVISIATFIGLSSFLDYGKSMVGMQYENSNIDFVMQSADVKFYRELQNRFNLKESAFYYSHMSSTGVPVMAMNHEAFVEFAKQAGIHSQDYSKVAIMNDLGLQLSENGKYQIRRWTDIKDGDNYRVTITPETPEKCQHVQHRTDEEWGDYDFWEVDEACVKAEGAEPYEIDLKITKVTDKRPLGLEGSGVPFVMVSDQYYRYDKLSFGKGIFTQFFAAHVEDVPAITNYIDQLVAENKIDKTHYSDVKADTAQMRNMYILICIFLYGFIIVVMLIGVTNIFNTITTNIALRAKEFAMLKSIGMTSSEFSRMIRLESLMYSTKALVIGLPLGIGLSVLIYLSFANTVDFGYILPWASILISIVVVALLVSVIMHYSVKQVEKQNIIETIRSENI